MKTIFFSALLSLALANKPCNPNKQANCFKGRLEIKGICSNYTISVIEGNIDTSLVAANWQDENTGKKYQNVFALDNPCSFPADIEQGGEFYFTLSAEKEKDCNVCMAYYPVPPKRLSIAVSKMPCR